MKCSGFLLLEVALVLGLILIVITLATPQFRFLKKQALRSEVQKLMAECFYLRSCALATHQDLVLTCNPRENSYKTKNKTSYLEQGIRFGFLPSLKGPPSNPKQFLTQAITFLNNTIKFHADGTMSSGTVYFLDSENSFCGALTIPSGQLPFIRQYEFHDHWVLIS